MSQTERSLDALDDAFASRRSRYLIGIDLGTTNCAVAFIDTEQPAPRVEVFPIEQMVDAATRQASDTLPSFHYELLEGEKGAIEGLFKFGDGSHAGVVGIFARDRSQEVPGRAISSAKSWLCNEFVDRASDLLPWGGDDDIAKISPVEASRRYLEHIRRCWDRSHPQHPMGEQETIVTLPASFDELARRLTIQAAEMAGIRKLFLIEEPQAAFYAWLARHESDWTKKIQAGQSILVCDIGGGTTDFTLIRVTDRTRNDGARTSNLDLSEEVSAQLQAECGLHRVAVGEHLMLGGDNLDLALAKGLEDKLVSEAPDNERLKPKQWDALKLQCRRAKEAMLGANPPEEYRFSIPGSGAKLIESTKSFAVGLQWAHELLLGGFFGRVPLNTPPEANESGFQEFGLPYASDPNILKHLGTFLWEHRRAGRGEVEGPLSDRLAARPDWILFNGGVLESPQIQGAILDQITDWFREENPDWRPGVLEGNRLDLAVAQGAAYYGKVRRGEGVRIDAQLARAYYIQVEQAPPHAMCIMPANAQPGDRFVLDQHPLHVLAGAPVQFPMFVSTTRLLDKPGDIVDIDWNKMHSAAPIHTVLELPKKNQQRSLPVVLMAELSEIGTLQLQLAATDAEGLGDASNGAFAWQLECDARGSGTGLQNSFQRSIEPELLQRGAIGIANAFGPDSNIPPKDAWDILTESIGKGRREWEPPLLRELWKGLMENGAYRARSAAHEARWLNLLGWTLRPGFGVAADDWRVQSTWRAVHNKLMHRSPASQSEVIVLWRRISGGFTAGQQKALYQDVWSKLRPTLSGGSSSGLGNNLTIELLRLVGSLERLPPKDKESILRTLVESMGKKRMEPLVPAMLWGIGRLGARVPIYAGYESLTRADRVEALLKKLLTLPIVSQESNRSHLSLCLMQCARLTGDRRRDLSHSFRTSLLASVADWNLAEKHMQPIRELTASEEDLESIVGDSLPLGFSMG